METRIHKITDDLEKDLPKFRLLPCEMPFDMAINDLISVKKCYDNINNIQIDESKDFFTQQSEVAMNYLMLRQTLNNVIEKLLFMYVNIENTQSLNKQIDYYGLNRYKFAKSELHLIDKYLSKNE